jgi:hypothetical protein
LGAPGKFVLDGEVLPPEEAPRRPLLMNACDERMRAGAFVEYDADDDTLASAIAGGKERHWAQGVTVRIMCGVEAYAMLKVRHGGPAK